MYPNNPGDPPMDQKTSQDSAPSAIPYESLSAFIKFGVDAGNTLGEAFKTGSFDLGQLGSMFHLVSEGKRAFSHLDDMKASLLALTEQQRADLYSYVTTNLNMPEAGLQESIEKALLTVCKLHEIYLLWK